MIGIITETRLTQEKLDELKAQGVLVNTELNYPTRAQANNYVVAKCDQLIFKLDKFLHSSRKAIETALHYKKQVVVQLDQTRIKILGESDWRQHQIKKIFDEKQKQDKQIKDDHTRQIQIEELMDTQLTEEQLIYTRTFARLYQIEYNEDDTLETFIVHQQVKYYVDNNVPYDIPVHSTLGLLDPDETPFADITFQDPEDYLEVTSFGNQIYFEDYVYKRGR